MCYGILARKAQWMLAVLLALGCGWASAGVVTSTWTGASSTQWWESLNWDNRMVPFNDAMDDFIARIVPSATVVCNHPKPFTLYGLWLEQNATLNLYPGTAMTVTDSGLFNGGIVADHATLAALPGGDYLSTNGRTSFSLARGAQVSIPLTALTLYGFSENYNWDGGQYNHELVVAADPGSLLDLSAVTSIDASFDDNNGHRNVKKVVARNGGAIDLTGVVSIRGPQRGEDRLDFIADATSSILFGDLASVTNPWGSRVRFDFDQPAWGFDHLVAADYVDFYPASGATVEVPLLGSLYSAEIALPSNAVLNAPVLTRLNASSLTIQNDAVFNAPSLTVFSGSTVALNPRCSFVSGPLAAIDNSVFSLSGGVQWGVASGGMAALSYTTTGLNQHVNWDNYQHSRYLLTASDAGTVLDLSSLASLNAGFDDGSGYRLAQRIRALAGGTIDLSGLVTMTGPVRNEDWLGFEIDSISQIDLSKLDSVTSASSGWVRFDVKRPDWSLDALRAGNYIEFLLGAGTALDLPRLETLTNSALTVNSHAVVNLPSINSLTGTTIALNDYGTINAPGLRKLTNGSLTLNPTRVFNVGELIEIDNMIFNLSGGLKWGVLNGDLSALNYSITGLNQNYNWDGSQYNRDIIVVTDVDTLLDLSSLTSIYGAFNDENGNRNVLKFKALAGGKIDFSSVTTITGPSRGEDRLDFIADSISTIDLPSLTTVSNPWGARVRFDIAQPVWSLDALANAANADFMLGQATTLNLPSLVSCSNAVVSMGPDSVLNAEHAILFSAAATLADNARLNIPAATRLNNCSFTQAAGSTVNAPLARELSYSSVLLDPQFSFLTGVLTNIDNSSFRVVGGMQWGAGTGQVAAAGYSSTGLNQSINWDGSQHNRDLIYVANQGSLLDLSSLRLFNAGFDDVSGYRLIQKVRVESGGRVDLSHVDILTAPARGEDWLDFYAQTDGVIDLSGLDEIRSAGGGRVRFIVNEGKLILGGIFATPYADLSLSNPNGRIEVQRDWLFAPGGTISTSAPNGYPMLSLAGNYSFANTNEAQIKLENARVLLNGAVTAPVTAPAAGSPAGELMLAMGGIDPAGYPDGMPRALSTYYAMLASDDFADAAGDFLELVKTLRIKRGLATYPAMGPDGILADNPNDPVLGIQYFEVGCLDGGSSGAVTNNFAIGQLIVGESNRGSVVYLTDLIDNGNRGTAGKECLYLPGFGDADGLRILGGSTLVIQGINVYAKMGGQMVHVNGLFNGENAIAWDQGFISIDPVFGACGNTNHPYAASDISLDCQVNLADYAGICAQWLGGDCLSPDWCDGADLNHDGRVDGADLGILTGTWLD